VKKDINQGLLIEWLLTISNTEERLYERLAAYSCDVMLDRLIAVAALHPSVMRDITSSYTLPVDYLLSLKPLPFISTRN